MKIELSKNKIFNYSCIRAAEFELNIHEARKLLMAASFGKVIAINPGVSGSERHGPQPAENHLLVPEGGKLVTNGASLQDHHAGAAEEHQGRKPDYHFA